MMAFRTVLHYLGRFLLFWRDFLIGDDWWGAGIVLLGFGLTYLVVRRDAPAFWVLALFVAISLVQSLWRTKRNDKHETRSSAVPPTRANGKVCYIEIPATDIPALGRFLRQGLRLEYPAEHRRPHCFRRHHRRSQRQLGARPPSVGRARALDLHHGRQRGGERGGRHRERRRDRTADRCGRAGADREVPGPRRERPRSLPGTERIWIRLLGSSLWVRPIG